MKFLSDFLRSKNNHHGRQAVKKEQVDEFAVKLRESLIKLFQGHWHPTQPMRGSGFRCIINQSANGTMDPMLLCVGRLVGIPEFLLRRYLPVEMAVWIDPNDVSYRIGEQGSICSLLGTEKENEMGGRYGVSPIGGRSAGSRTNSLSYSPDKLMTLQQQQQQQQRQRLSPESLRQDSTTATTMTTTTTTSSKSTTSSMSLKSQTEQSNDSGIELSPSTSPRPSAANTISNSSSPVASPLASPVREQPPPGKAGFLLHLNTKVQNNPTLG